MSEERKQILQMVADGTITIDEAERLLAVLDGMANTAGAEPIQDHPVVLEQAEQRETLEFKEPLDLKEPLKAKRVGMPKFLHIKVRSEPGSGRRHENVDIKIPLLLLRAGVKLSSLVPDRAKGQLSAHLAEKGIDFDLQKLKTADLDTLIQALSESSIDVDADKETVRIYCA